MRAGDIIPAAWRVLGTGATATAMAAAAQGLNVRSSRPRNMSTAHRITVSSYTYVGLLGIGGQEGMSLISRITVARGKARLGKEDKHLMTLFLACCRFLMMFLGGYDIEEKAATAYHLAALKYWRPGTHINLPLENYRQQLEEMKNMSRQEYVARLTR